MDGLVLSMHSLWRASVLALFLGMAGGGASAQELAVPIALQMQLLDHLLWYERGFARERDQPAHLVIVTKRDSTQSARAAGQVRALLAKMRTLGGRVVTSQGIEYGSAEQVAAEVVASHASLAYLAPGLESVVGELADALRGRAMLTVAADAKDVARGAVLGFELASSKPRIVVNLTRARAQKLEFSAQLLRIARVTP